MTLVHFRANWTPKKAYQMRQLSSRTVRFDLLWFLHARMCLLDRFSNNRHSPTHVSIIIEVLTARSCILREFTTIFKNSCKFVPIWIENVSTQHVIATRQLFMHNIWHTFNYEQFEPKKCISDASIRPQDGQVWSVKVRSWPYVFVWSIQ
jgi:hypothetical protein